MIHKSEQILFIVVILVLIGGCFLVEEQRKVINVLRKGNFQKDDKIYQLSFDLTEANRINDLKTNVLEPNEYYMPVDNPVITSELGLRDSPLDGVERVHFGTDCYSNATKNIYAVRDGEIITHYPAPDGYHRGHPVYGAYIELQTDNGLAAYGHMSETFVKEGQWVKAGDIIGIIGETGMSVGKHLHYAYYLDIFKGA